MRVSTWPSTTFSASRPRRTNPHKLSIVRYYKLQSILGFQLQCDRSSMPRAMSCTRKFSGKLPCHWRYFGSLSLALCSLATNFNASLRCVPFCLCWVPPVSRLKFEASPYPHDIEPSFKLETYGSEYHLENLDSPCASHFHLSIYFLLPGSKRLAMFQHLPTVPNCTTPHYEIVSVGNSRVLAATRLRGYAAMRLRIWSIWSLAQGFAADATDWRVPHLKSYWNLVVRLSWFVGGGKCNVEVRWRDLPWLSRCSRRIRRV